MRCLFGELYNLFQLCVRSRTKPKNLDALQTMYRFLLVALASAARHLLHSKYRSTVRERREYHILVNL